jgi:DNA-binding transcriptional ArsR family regulator
LRVLREANLVTVRQAGRERRYRLNAHPLREVADWANGYERFWSERLAALGELLENESE